MKMLAWVAAVLFTVSWGFPIAAGLSSDTSSFPKWWGVVDVGLAFVLAFLALAIDVGCRKRIDRETEQAAYRAYRVLSHAVLAFAVVVMVYGGRITWMNCLSGFAWRTWLLLYVLPAWIAGVKRVKQASLQVPY